MCVTLTLFPSQVQPYSSWRGLELSLAWHVRKQR